MNKVVDKLGDTLVLFHLILASTGSPFDKLRVLRHNCCMHWFVYILFCDEKTYYVGLSHNPAQRFQSHIEKRNIATKEFSHLECVHVEQFKTRAEAERREKQIKGWSKAKKKALITGNIELLKNLSKTHGLVER